MKYWRLGGIVLVLIGTGLVVYNAPIVFVAFTLGPGGWGMVEEPMWESARQGFASGAVLMLGGVFLARWK